MKKHLMIVVAFTVFGGLILVRAAWSQQHPLQAQPIDGQLRLAQPQPGGGFFRTAGNAPSDFASLVAYGAAQNLYYGDLRDNSLRSEIEQLTNQLREADDDAKKADLTEKLEAAVAKYFDEDMGVRETELTKLEERLTKLRAQLDRRRKAKAGIIQLEIKVLVNEAEGLGFSTAPQFNTNPYSVMMSGTVAGMPSSNSAAPAVIKPAGTKTTSPKTR